MNTKIIGIIILVLAIGGGVAYKAMQEKIESKVTVRGLIGSEKEGFFEDAEVKKVLLQKYNIELDYGKAGSIEMVQNESGKYDFLFPGSQIALEVFKNSGKKGKAETIFYSPIVFYSWDIVAEAFVKEGIARSENSVHYVDTKKLIDLTLSAKKWSDIGLSALFGRVIITPTDPLKSNSGNQYFGLLANMLINEVANGENIQTVLPQIIAIYKSIGYMERSSGFLFEQYLTTGVGAKPIIVGYENQIIEFCVLNSAICDRVKQKVRILYPEPTVWSSHILIATTQGGERLIEALKDQEIQRLAWEKHGFRAADASLKNDVSKIGITGVPQDITKVVQMPSFDAVDTILKALEAK